jgi:hypothetical protein
MCRSQWPRSLRRGSAAASLLGLWFRNTPGAWISVCRVYCVSSGSGLCDELITRPAESYRLWCVVVCDLETSWMWRPYPTEGCCAKEKNCIFYYSRPEFLNAQRVQHCRQWGQTVTQWHINPRVVHGEHEAHFLACRQTTQGDGATSFAVVDTLGYQVVTLQRNNTVTSLSRSKEAQNTAIKMSHFKVCWGGESVLKNKLNTSVQSSHHTDSQNSVIKLSHCREKRNTVTRWLCRRKSHNTAIR